MGSMQQSNFSIKENLPPRLCYRQAIFWQDTVRVKQQDKVHEIMHLTHIFGWANTHHQDGHWGGGHLMMHHG